MCIALSNIHLPRCLALPEELRYLRSHRGGLLLLRSISWHHHGCAQIIVAPASDWSGIVEKQNLHLVFRAIEPTEVILVANLPLDSLYLKF